MIARALDFPGFLVQLAKASESKVREHAFRRDDGIINRWRWIADGVRKYFSGEVRGWDHLPNDGPLMIVSNHSGGLLMPDAYVLYSCWLDERAGQSLFVLAHDLIFLIPGFEKLARGAGVVPGRMRYAERLIDEGESVLVFPGGELEVFRPFTQRNQIQFQGHKGFVRLALSRGVPIVPLVSYGAQDVNLFLSRGQGLARTLRLDRARVKIVPLVGGLPWGLVPGFIPLLPLPTKITLEFQKPLAWPDLLPEAADDPKVVTRCYNQVVDRMQRALWRMADERPNPFSRK